MGWLTAVWDEMADSCMGWDGWQLDGMAGSCMGWDGMAGSCMGWDGWQLYVVGWLYFYGMTIVMVKLTVQRLSADKFHINQCM